MSAAANAARRWAQPPVPHAAPAATAVPACSIVLAGPRLTCSPRGTSLANLDIPRQRICPWGDRKRAMGRGGELRRTREEMNDMRYQALEGCTTCAYPIAYAGRHRTPAQIWARKLQVMHCCMQTHEITQTLTKWRLEAFGITVCKT